MHVNNKQIIYFIINHFPIVTVLHGGARNEDVTNRVFNGCRTEETQERTSKQV